MIEISLLGQHENLTRNYIDSEYFNAREYLEIEACVKGFKLNRIKLRNI